MMRDLELFFEKIKDVYGKENCKIDWSWEDIKQQDNEELIFYLALNLSKNIIHGPLPKELHNRMAFENNFFL